MMVLRESSTIMIELHLYTSINYSFNIDYLLLLNSGHPHQQLPVGIPKRLACRSLICPHVHISNSVSMELNSTLSLIDFLNKHEKPTMPKGWETGPLIISRTIEITVPSSDNRNIEVVEANFRQCVLNEYNIKINYPSDWIRKTVTQIL